MVKIDWDKLFPDNREQGETTLRQCQLVMIRMLKILDYLCSKHQIEYFLTGGTLLGAIRHKGFIPWDDDVDVGMTRSSYEKFIELAVPELPRDIFFQNTDTDPSYPPCKSAEARLRDKYSRYVNIDKPQSKWHVGLGIDIFVYDRAFLPHNFFIALTNSFFLKVVKNNRIRANVLKWISKYSPFPLVYANDYICGFKIAFAVGGCYTKKEELASLLRVPFEDMETWVPVGWEQCLRRQYGDYMRLPPPGKRVSHHKVIADPFHPCDHSDILHWNERVVRSNSKMYED